MSKSRQDRAIATECYSCVKRQALSASKFARLDSKQTAKILKIVNRELLRSVTTPIMVQHIVRLVADAIIQLLNESADFDIYKDVKKNSNKLAMASFDTFKSMIKGSLTPLEKGIQLAAAGNIIDFGAKDHKSLDLEAEISALHTTTFGHYDIKEFKDSLIKASTLLYICDNAGEIVFDTLFIKVIQNIYPKISIIATVREKPIINDATLKDAVDVGLDQVVQTISSGSVYPGTILTEASDEFKELFENVDLIIAKGQGNFETLLDGADKRLFFLLRIKCDYMAQLSGVHKDNLVLMQGNKIEQKYSV